MLEFIGNYGLWVVLAGVFFAMHRVGMGCCGGGHRHGADGRSKGISDELPDKGKTSEDGQDSQSGCH